MAIAATTSPSFAADLELHGAGATFPYPVYAAWAAEYRRDTGLDVRYEAVGSGVGVDLIEHRLVDFGASDAPLSPEELHRIGAMQFPAVIGGVVPVVNIGGLRSGELKLSGEVLADIYLGKVTQWDAPAIADLNPGVDLPSSHITVVHRADASGTTFLWSHYLAATSTAWRTAVGAGTTLAWPTGEADTGNDGVASTVQRTRMSIGYVEYTYARQHNLTAVSVRNHDGVFVMPGRPAFEAAARAATWRDAADLSQLLIDEPGADSWPIAGASFILLRTQPEQPRRSVEVMKFFAWALAHGQAIADDLGYMPLPDSAAPLIAKAWSMEVKTGNLHPMSP